MTFDALVDAAAATPVWPRFASTAGAAACAAVLATLASQPGDALLSEVSRGRDGNGASEDVEEGEHDRDLVAIVAQLGLRGLARGLRARLVQVGVIVTVQLVLYDTLKHAFGVP